jgi:hypothetical protein
LISSLQPLIEEKFDQIEASEAYQAWTPANIEMHQKQPTAAMQDGRDMSSYAGTKFTPYEPDNVQVERIPVFSG